MRRDEFFALMNSQAQAVTFSDLSLNTGYSTVLPTEVTLKTRFSRRIELNVPIVSSPMDTVTESTLAIEMARLGGIGVIHRNLTPEEQAREVARVKYFLNGLIDRPITASPTETVQEVLERRKAKNFSFHSFPVVDEKNKLVGLLTETEFKFCGNGEKKVSEVMTTELITAPLNTSSEEAYQDMQNNRKSVLPLVNNVGQLCGMYVWSDVKRITEDKSPLHCVDGKGRLRVAAAIGTLKDNSTWVRLTKLHNEHVDALVVDTAHAHTEDVLETIHAIKRENSFAHIDLVVGNVSGGVAVADLIKAGADAIKVGQGDGSICTTRIVAGVGCPQMTAIYNCANEAKGRKERGVEAIPIIADGGIVYSGDITKALAAGAQCVMLGKLLAGTRETPGELVHFRGRQYKNYRGMGSVGAMTASRESRARYGQGMVAVGKLVPEGVEAIVPYAGELSEVLLQLLGGLRSGMGSIGAADIVQLQEKADFIRVTAGGNQESHPHDVTMIEDAPNYKCG